MSKSASKTQSISTKLAKLDEAVDWFYSEDFNLDRALDQYSAATKLAAEIEQDLTELKNKVTVIADFTKG